MFQVLLVRHHRKEKRYGPSPANNYTSGAGRRPLWRRNKRNHNTRDAELATGGALAAEKHGHVRPSDDTAFTDNTLHNQATYGNDHTTYGNNQGTYGNNQGTYGHGHPTGTAVNY